MTVQLDHRPGLGRLYAKAVATARSRRGDQLPETSVEMADVTIDREQLASYAEVCGFRHSDVLPLTYPHVLAFPLAVTLMVDPSFPFPLPGLVHVANRITQQRPIRADERLTLRVRAANLRAHPRGRQFDMTIEATVASESVWTEASTYLRRERTAHPPPRPSTSSSPSPQGGEGRVGAPIQRPYGGSREISVAATPRFPAMSTRSTSTRWPLDCSASAAPSPMACG